MIAVGGLFLLGLAILIAVKLAPKEHKGKGISLGQIGLASAIALFGVDYFTSFFYATGEILHVLHPAGLEHYVWIPALVVAGVNIIFGVLYLYSLEVFNEGGGSYTASMRYLAPAFSLIVAVTLLEDYLMTIVVSSLSGADQLLSVMGAFNSNWLFHFAIGAVLVTGTWLLTISGRGESARTVFILLAIFGMLTALMAGGLVYATLSGKQPVAPEPPATSGPPGLLKAIIDLVTASMKGLVALTGLEAMSNGIQFLRDEDAGIIQWAKKKLPRQEKLWKFYSGKVGVGRIVQSSFLFYGGITTAFAASFAVHFHVFDGTAGRTLVGNLAYIGFSVFPNGSLMFGFYQILSVLLLAAASMTAFQDVQATGWRDATIGEVPEFVCERDRKGTFSKAVTAGFAIAIAVMFLVGGSTNRAMPFYGIGVFLPIAIMGWAVRKDVLLNVKDPSKRYWGALAAGMAAVISTLVFLTQLFSRWEEGGWMRLITFTILFTGAHIILVSKVGRRTERRVHFLVHAKAHVQGAMADIVEWQAKRMQEYRHELRLKLHSFYGRFGMNFPAGRKPINSGKYPVDPRTRHVRIKIW